MARGKTEMEVGSDGVAVITIINPPVNSLSIDGNVVFSDSQFCLNLRLMII